MLAAMSNAQSSYAHKCASMCWQFFAKWEGVG